MNIKPNKFESKAVPRQKRIDDLRDIFNTTSQVGKHSSVALNPDEPENLTGFRTDALTTKFKMNDEWWLIMGMERNGKECQCVNLDSLKHYVIDNFTIICCFEGKGSKTQTVPEEYNLAMHASERDAHKKGKGAKPLTKVIVRKPKDIKIDPKLLIPIKSGTLIDGLLSSDGGLMPASNYMILGDPGVGKSTLLLEICYNMEQVDPTKRALFVSGEMNEFDFAHYLKRFPKFGDVDTIFLSDYVDNNMMDVIEQAFSMKYDVIVLDSIAEVVDSVAEANEISSKVAEKWFIDLMIQCNKGFDSDRNLMGVHTSFLAIQQVTKGGNFVGSNKLAHNTTGTIEFRYTSGIGSPRYARTVKNRRGVQHPVDKLFFDLESGEVKYDEAKLLRAIEAQEKLKDAANEILTDSEFFAGLVKASKADDNGGEEINYNKVEEAGRLEAETNIANFSPNQTSPIEEVVEED